MKKQIIMALALCGTTLSPIFATAAYADPPTPINDTSGEKTPDEVCQDVLRPNDPNSEFQTTAINVGDPAWSNVGSPEQGDAAGDPEPWGDPKYENIYLTNGFFRNGGSPNVWGGATATAIYPQTRQLFHFTQDQERTVSFDCQVWKVVGNGDSIYPPGLQSSGNSTLETRTVDADDAYVITDDDFPVYGETVYALVCISPNNTTKGKPGTWTGKNGFNAANCPAASTAAGTNFIPSGNAPIL
jgi:hypothetical protein